MSALLDIANWKNQLGLLPINLSSKGINKQFILLNGGCGDFCIDLNPEELETDYHSFAWSSDTKVFLSVEKDKVELFNWFKGNSEEIDNNFIGNNLSKLHEYIKLNSPKSEYDIVPFIIDIFRKIRNEIGEEAEGIRSINQLFLLLAAYEGNKTDFNDIDKRKWNLTEIDKIPTLDRYLDNLKNGLAIKGNKLKLSIELILRHSSGKLFQEAQREVLFNNRDYDLFGDIHSDYNSFVKRFSSFHYTPSYLARTIVEYSLSKLNLEDKTSIKILDPACGSSEFLLEALKQLKSTGFSGTIKIDAWDSSESAINISSFLIGYEKRHWNNQLEVNIKQVNNSLTEKWEDDYDLILMNPPFLSWELMDNEQREIATNSLGELCEKKPNLASAFIYKSIQHLSKDGIIGSVIPSSILLMDSYKKIRNNIKDTLELLLVGKLGNFIFESALTDVSIFIGKNSKSQTSPLLLWSRNEKGIVADAFSDLRRINYKQIPYQKDKNSYSIYIPDKYPDQDDWKINSYKEEELKKQLNKLVLSGRLKRVKDIFDVKQGIRTGNKELMINDKIYLNLPEGEKIFFRKGIEKSGLKNGIINKIIYMWYPYNESGLIIKDEEELKEKAKYFYENHLIKIKEDLIKRSKIKSDSWWALCRHRNWLIKIYPKIISNEFGSSGSFAFDTVGDLVFERGNAWIPIIDFEKEDYFYFYLALFNSSFFEKLLSLYSKQLAGGNWYYLGKKYTSNIPIPEINSTFENTKAYNDLVEIGKDISSGEYLQFANFDSIDRYLIPDIYNIDYDK